MSNAVMIKRPRLTATAPIAARRAHRVSLLLMSAGHRDLSATWASRTTAWSTSTAYDSCSASCSVVAMTSRSLTADSIIPRATPSRGGRRPGHRRSPGSPCRWYWATRSQTSTTSPVEEGERKVGDPRQVQPKPQASTGYDERLAQRDDHQELESARRVVGARRPPRRRRQPRRPSSDVTRAPQRSRDRGPAPERGPSRSLGQGPGGIQRPALPDQVRIRAACTGSRPNRRPPGGTRGKATPDLDRELRAGTAGPVAPGAGDHTAIGRLGEHQSDLQHPGTTVVSWFELVVTQVRAVPRPPTTTSRTSSDCPAPSQLRFGAVGVRPAPSEHDTRS